MTRVLILLSLVGLMFVSVGTYIYPENAAFWLASSGAYYQYIRIFLTFLLIIQLTSRLSAHFWFRIVSGLVAISLSIWMIEAAYFNSIQVIDLFLFLGVSFAIGILTLEYTSKIIDLKILPIKKNKLVKS